MPSPNRKPPSKRTLKSAILWCSRWMLGDGEFYAGRVSVEITAAKEGETIRVVPSREVDGLGEPPPLCSAGGTQPATPAELLRVLLSEDEKRILRALLEAGSGAKAKHVAELSRVETSRFYPLWTNLQFRGFVADAEGSEGGYVLAVPWVQEILEMGVGVRPA